MPPLHVVYSYDATRRDVISLQVVRAEGNYHKSYKEMRGLSRLAHSNSYDTHDEDTLHGNWGAFVRRQTYRFGRPVITYWAYYYET